MEKQDTFRQGPPGGREVMFEPRPGQNYGEERHQTRGNCMCKGPETELRYFLKPLGCIAGKKGLLGQRRGMEVAEAGKWLQQHLGRR